MAGILAWLNKSNRFTIGPGVTATGGTDTGTAMAATTTAITMMTTAMATDIGPGFVCISDIAVIMVTTAATGIMAAMGIMAGTAITEDTAVWRTTVAVALRGHSQMQSVLA